MTPVHRFEDEFQALLTVDSSWIFALRFCAMVFTMFQVRDFLVPGDGKPLFKVAEASFFEAAAISEGARNQPRTTYRNDGQTDCDNIAAQAGI